MRCNCEEAMARELKHVQSTARIHRYSLIRQLDAFKEGIQQGADSLAVVHLYRAGVYLSGKDRLSYEFTVGDVIASLEDELSHNNPVLRQFLTRHHQEIMDEDFSADKRKMLFGILRQKKKAIGLLTGRANSEIENAQRALDRANEISQKLFSWKEGLQSTVVPELIFIADIHKPESTSQSSE